MRRSLPLFVLLLAGTASCGGGNRTPQNQEPRGVATGGTPTTEAAPPAPASMSADSAQGRAAGGPNIAPTAAPGVAFNYNYSYALAFQRVAELQERHAAMCEQLTVARCRITGMRYEVLGPNDIRASLELKLDPAIARTFGREASAAVLQADGMVTETVISGVDAGSQIRQAGTDITRLQADLARIQQQLAGRIDDESAPSCNPRRRSCASRSARSATSGRRSRKASRPRRWCSTTARATSSPATVRRRASARRSARPGPTSRRAALLCSRR